jgi:hypothetical protein
LDWIDTPDDFLPACTYEPTILKMYHHFGWFITSWWNLSFRNVGMAFTWRLAIPVSNYWYAISDQEKQERGLFDNHYRISKLVLKIGYISYRNWKNYRDMGNFVAVPRITLRLESDVEM